MASIFTKIINHEIPGQFIYKDGRCVAVMDKFPTVTGQSLVIPKQEVDYTFDLDDDLLTHLIVVAKKVALASDKALGSVRTCMVIEGFEVPHVHFKLYPMHESDKPLGAKIALGHEASDEELTKIATQIMAALED